MSLNQVHMMLETIANTSSTNEKEKHLASFLKNPLFRKTVQYAYNQGWSYNITDVTYHGNRPGSVEEIFDFLDYLREKGSASNQDKEALNRLSSIDSETSEVVRRIITKDLRAGFGSKLIEKVMPGTVELVPYQRCSDMEFISRMIYPAVVQKKADSMFAYGFPWKQDNLFTTRAGNNFNIHGYLHQDLREIIGDRKLVTVGELQVLDVNYDKVLDRKTGNGYLNSFISGEGDPEIAKRVIYSLWDLIPYEHYLAKFSPQTYAVRFGNLMDLVKAWTVKNFGSDGIGPIDIIPYEIVHTENEARAFYLKMRSGGFEGAILKNFSSTWEPKTSRNMVKLKNRVEAEFEIVDAYYGKEGKKNAHLLGGLTVKSSDGNILTNVGSGFSKKDREKGVDWWRQHIGKIVTIEFESVISEKTGRKTYKLYTPSFIETRFNEKTEADTLQYCLDKCNPHKE